MFSKMLYVSLWLFSKAIDHWKGYTKERASLLYSFPTDHSQKQAIWSLIWLRTSVMFLLALQTTSLCACQKCGFSDSEIPKSSIPHTLGLTEYPKFNSQQTRH